jgi:porin
MTNPRLTYDMRAFHLHGAQLQISATFGWVSWNPAGPSAVSIDTLYLFKSFAEGRVETKFGYMVNDFEFLGLHIGGALTTGGQGVYAILPYEVGLNHYPVPSPSFNLKLNGPKQLYFKGAVQRSIDPSGGPATIARNATGLRFLVKGDKMVNVYEVGYNHPPLPTSHESWVRAGYIHNTTPFPNSRTGISTPGNFCAYILADHQFLQSNRAGPNQGIYAGASAIGDSTDLNAYTRYYEFRLYDEGPFPSRPGDTLSMVASHSDFSRYTIAGFAAQNESFWRNSSSLTGSYTIRISRGNYLGAGLSYVTGPAITPRLPNALTFTIVHNFFF